MTTVDWWHLFYSAFPTVFAIFLLKLGGFFDKQLPERLQKEYGTDRTLGDRIARLNSIATDWRFRSNYVASLLSAVAGVIPLAEKRGHLAILAIVALVFALALTFYKVFTPNPGRLSSELIDRYSRNLVWLYAALLILTLAVELQII